jgi:excisionase family DNA binding protein
MEKLMNVNAVGECLGISPFTVRLYIRQGKLTPIKIGRRILVSPSEVERFVTEAQSKGNRHTAGTTNS